MGEKTRAIKSDIRLYKSAANTKNVYGENGRENIVLWAQKGNNPGMGVETSGLCQQLAAGPWEGPFPFLCLFLSSESQGLDLDDSRAFWLQGPEGMGNRKPWDFTE